MGIKGWIGIGTTVLLLIGGIIYHKRKEDESYERVQTRVKEIDQKKTDADENETLESMEKEVNRAISEMEASINVDAIKEINEYYEFFEEIKKDIEKDIEKDETLSEDEKILKMGQMIVEKGLESGLMKRPYEGDLREFLSNKQNRMKL